MTPTTTDAIVLRTLPYSESTLLVWLLTRDYGVVRALAKGARRLKGRNSAALDQFALARVGLRMPQGDRLAMLGAVHLVQAWLYLRSDVDRLAFASLALETLGAVAATSPPEPFYIDEAVDYLDQLEQTAAPGSLTALVLIRLLFHSGQPVRIEGSERNREGASPFFDFNEGQIRWRGRSEENLKRCWRLSAELVDRVSPILADPPALAAVIPLPRSLGIECLIWLVRVWEDRLNQRLRSGEFIEKIYGLKAGFDGSDRR